MYSTAGCEQSLSAGRIYRQLSCVYPFDLVHWSTSLEAVQEPWLYAMALVQRICVTCVYTAAAATGCVCPNFMVHQQVVSHLCWQLSHSVGRGDACVAAHHLIVLSSCLWPAKLSVRHC
jgi:hypothetical protein